MPGPEKQDIPKELWRIASTLSQDAQEAAARKCQELGFDPNKGRVSLEELFINMTDARDVILDAVEKNKITQLPLKLQSSLLDQLTLVSDQLTSISNGKDAILPLEAAVEELTASIWSYQLHNLSGEVLGYQTKMNQLKAQETLIRQVSREATEFSTLKSSAVAFLTEISTTAASAKSEEAALHESLGKITDALQSCTDTQQKISALAAQVQQNEIVSTQQVSNVSQSAANVQATEKNVKEIAIEVSTVRSELGELVSKAQQLISGTETTTHNQIESFKNEFETVRAAADGRANELATKIDNLTAESSGAIAQRLDAANATVHKLGSDLDSRASQLYTDTKARLDQAASAQQITLDGQFKEFTALHENALGHLNETLSTSLKAFAAEKQAAMDHNRKEFELRVEQLDELEGSIRKSIERATGFTLFHSFQNRQLELEKTKRFWAYALGALVLISLCASSWFIYSLKFVQVYNAAFYLKLSISIPIIYAIAFCNVQYSRERRLEEEYAFKSSISISLDPYQRLVRSLVDEAKPEELAKYTAFVIDSVNKVFTSPTKIVFGDDTADLNTFQKMTKSLGDFIEPVV